MDEKTQRKLMDAAHLALGSMLAIKGVTDPAVYFLASALREAGSESDYVRDIVRTNQDARKESYTG